MPLELRALQLAKDADRPAECQDAWSADACQGVVAVADGVTNAIFSGAWARLLVEAIVAEAPQPAGDWDWTAWLAPLRRRWSETIDQAALPWFQRAKMAVGAFATVVWIELDPPPPDAPDEYPCRAFAVGDSCLLHLREGRLLWSFPLEHPAQFDSYPSAIGSIDLQRDPQIRLSALQLTVRSGDVLLLATDAVAAWALEACRQPTPPDWQRYWDLPAEAWRDEVQARRAEGAMRCDDATLVLVRPAAGGRIVEPPPRGAGEPVTAAVVDEPRRTPPAPNAPIQPPAAPPVDRWADAVVSKTEEVAGQVTEGVLRGLRKLKDALRKHSDRRPPGDAEPGPPQS